MEPFDLTAQRHLHVLLRCGKHKDVPFFPLEKILNKDRYYFTTCFLKCRNDQRAQNIDSCFYDNHSATKATQEYVVGWYN